MEEKSVKSIPLPNDLTLELFDLSKKISEKAFQVTMTARIIIPVKASLFPPETLEKISLDEILNKVGPSVTFEHHKVRNFILAPRRNAVFADLVDTFMETVLPYVTTPSFPGKYILKCYRDKK